MTSHHTALQGMDELIERKQAELVRGLEDLRGPEYAEKAETLQVRIVIEELVYKARANHDLARALDQLQGPCGLGVSAKGPLVRAIMESVQVEARVAGSVRPPAPLPAGVATPVPAPPRRPVRVDPPPDDDATPVGLEPVRGRLVNPIEVDATPHNAPTRPVGQRDVQLGWKPNPKLPPRGR